MQASSRSLPLLQSTPAAFEYAVKNTMFHLGPEWALYVVHGRSNAAFVKNALQGTRGVKVGGPLSVPCLRGACLVRASVLELASWPGCKAQWPSVPWPSTVATHPGGILASSRLPAQCSHRWLPSPPARRGGHPRPEPTCLSFTLPVHLPPSLLPLPCRSTISWTGEVALNRVACRSRCPSFPLRCRSTTSWTRWRLTSPP